MSSNSNNESKFGKFNLKTVALDNTRMNHYVSTDSSYVCLVPFEKLEDNRISAMYLLKFVNPTTGETDHSLIMDEVNFDVDSTSYDSVRRSLTEEAGLNIDELGVTDDRLFYLGDITMSVPVGAKMACYGIDLTGISKNPIEFTRTLAKDSFIKDKSSIVKVGFHQLVNGDYSDATVLAGSFLLVSYFV
jgi:hypothetical protein